MRQKTKPRKTKAKTKASKPTTATTPSTDPAQFDPDQRAAAYLHDGVVGALDSCIALAKSLDKLKKDDRGSLTAVVESVRVLDKVKLTAIQLITPAAHLFDDTNQPAGRRWSVALSTELHALGDAYDFLLKCNPSNEELACAVLLERAVEFRKQLVSQMFLLRKHVQMLEGFVNLSRPPAATTTQAGDGSAAQQVQAQAPEGEWSKPMPKKTLMSRLDLEPRAFETFAKQHGLKQISRQQWQIRLDKMDVQTRRHIETGR